MRARICFLTLTFPRVSLLRGKRPDGRCYSHVANYIDETGYGGISKNGFDAAIPSQHVALPLVIFNFTH